MLSPKKEPQGNGFSEATNTQSKRRNKLYCSDCSLEHEASQPRLLFRKSHTATPAFKCEPSPFRALSPPSSPPQYDMSFLKLPQLVSLQVSTKLPVRETLWNEGASFVTHIRAIKPSSVGKFNVEHEKPAVPKEKTKTKQKRKPKFKPLAGTEVVEMLAGKKHLGEHEFYYLKTSEDGPYRPYDLRVVSSSEAGTDYYTNTFTTITHVQNGCCIELWSLEEWEQESVLWGALRNIPFFRDYLLRKTFKRWHGNVHKATVKRRIEFLPSQLLIAVPQFRDALLHLARLIEEIKQVSWLPHDDFRTYTLLDFQTALMEKNQAAQVSLYSFLHCRFTILSKVKDNSYQAHQELQMKVENSKLYQSSQSLHLQLAYHRNLQKELSQAEQAIQWLGNLAALADRMTVQNLVTISKREITTFLNNVLKREREQQGGLFQTEIILGADCQLTVFPPLQLFQEVLLGALLSVADSVLQVLDSCSLSCDSKSCLSTSCVEDLTGAKGCEVTGPGNVSSQKEHDMSPKTLVPVKMNSLRVQGQRVRSHYQSLPQRLLEWNLKVHVGTQEIQNEQDKITQVAITEVHQLCESHSWLADVHLFTGQWSSASLETLRGSSPLKYEELIKKLHSWMDRVHSLLPSFTTSNKLFTVVMSNIQKDIGSILGTIDKDVLKLLCEDSQTRSENLISELKRAVEVMKSEPNTFHHFTVFSDMVKRSERMSGDMQKRLEDLHSLQETVRRNYTHMDPNNILSLKQVVDLWNQFVQLLKPAADIVTQKLHSMLDTLDKNVSSLVNELDNLVAQAASGLYLDPDQNPKEMLVQLTALCSEFYVIADQLNDQSRASEILRGHLLDLTFVTVAQQNMEARKGLWELMSVLSTQIQEWKLLTFKNFVVAKAQDKVNEWLQQAEASAKVIPSHDTLLHKTLQILQGFNQLLTFLSKLSSPTLKHKHWRSILKGIGLLNYSEWKLTLADLMSKELQKHQNKINKIYLDAKAEADMEQTFRALQRDWERAEFHHKRFIIAVQKQQDEVKEKKKIISCSSPQNAPKHHIIDGKTYTIIGLEALLAQTKESVLTFSHMLRSPHVAEFQQEVEHWLLHLQELDELLYIFERYQQKWIFLSRTFNDTVHTQKSELQEKFHPVDKMFRDIIQITVNDPYVSSFVRLGTTTEGSDSLQGQSLRAVLMNGLTAMEEISKHLLYILESPRSQLPRLYFLSDGEVMKLLSLQLPAPSSLLPLVQKCFKGVKQLDVQVEGDVCCAYDLTALSNERMCVHGVYGEFGEHVPFICPLESNLSPVAWLSLFEQKLNQAVKQAFLKCLAVQQKSNIEMQPSTPDLIGNGKENNSEVAHEPPSLLYLISQFPLQCLLVAEEVLWCSMIRTSSHCSTTGLWTRIKSQNAAKLHYLCQLLKEHSNEEPPQILTALRALVILTMKHSGQTDGLAEVKGDLESSFEWHKLMKYYLIPNDNGPSSDLLPSQQNQTVCVDILCTQLPYGYEYIGPDNWTMVTTPSTEQAYMGIILALSSFKCAFISGPHMSGKQHAAVQLGYALGRQVVILKCCSSTGSSVVSQMILGALQTGAWLVLDSVDLLEQGTLSELGQHLTEIHQHLAAVQRQEQAEAHELTSSFGKCSSGEFIKNDNRTMNEVLCHIAGKNIWAKLSYGCVTISDNGYSTEIPENLRIAMRPVAFMQPHYRIIAEVMLMSFGFSEAATISRRLVSLFSLAKDSYCLPDFVSGHQTSWLVLLRNVIALSVAHLHLSCHLKETDKDTFSCQNETGSACTRLETIPAKVEEHYSSHLKFINKSNATADLEEQAAIKGVLSVMQYTVSDPKRASQFCKICEEIFPKARYFSSPQLFIDEGEKKIVRSLVIDELQQQGLYADMQIPHNVLILHQALKLSNVVVLVGPAGSGKTTLYEALASALQKLSRTREIDSKGDFKDIYHYFPKPCWTSVSTEVIFPNTLSHKQFFGGYFGQDNSWIDGAFTRALRHSEQPLPIAPSKSEETVQKQQEKWIVLDGDPLGRPGWLDSLTTLCDLEHPHLYLSSGEKIEPSRLKILAEITNLGNSTPSVVTHCSLVYVSGENLWRSVWKSEMNVLSTEHNVDQITLEMWSHLSEDLFPDTLVFLKNKALSSVMASDRCEGRRSSRITDGLQEIMSFIKILHTLLEHSGKGEGLKNTSRKTETTNAQVFQPPCTDATASSAQWGLQARNIFIVAYVWGFGGHLHPRHWPHFDLFVREALYMSHCKVETPPEGTVFEHFFEFSEEMRETTNFINCSMRKSPQLFFTSVPQYEKHAYLLDMLLDVHEPVLIVGESGSGKTMLCKSVMSNARPHMHLAASLGLHPSELCKVLKRVRYQRTQVRSIEVLKQPNILLFIDDLHEAPFDVDEKTSVTLETLRQCISRGEQLISDSSHFKLFQSRDVNYLGSYSAPNAVNSNQISPRLSRLFTVLALPSMTSEILFSIHSTKLQAWLKEIQPIQRVADITNCILTSTLDMYFAVRECFTSALHSPIFIFSLHDVHKVFQGMYLWRPRLNVQQALHRSLGCRSFSSSVLGHPAHDLNITCLWMHECLHTFGDRLASEEACRKLISIIAEVSEKNFGTRLSNESQTSTEGISSPSDQPSRADNVNQHLGSTPSQLENNVIPVLGMTEVQTEREESYAVENDSRLYNPGSDVDGFSYSKDDGNVKSEPGTSECISESATEFSSCSFQKPFSHFGENKHDYINQKPASHEKLTTQHILLSTTTAKTFIQLLQEAASSVKNMVFSPEFCKPLNNILQHHNFEHNCVYQERDIDILVDQLFNTLKCREENKEKSDDAYYNPTWVVHHHNVHQLVHIIRAFLIPGGHGALLGAAKKTGRKSIVRLAATLLGCQLIEVHPGNEAKLWEMMKGVCSRIGVGGHLVLLVHEDTSQALKDELLVMMANGSFPILYSDEELKNLTKDTKALEMYFKNIQKNIHVFLLYPLLWDNSERQTVKSSVLDMHITKALSLCCCVEVYQPWTSEALAESALYHLKANQQIPETNRTVAKDSLIASISEAMARIHLSATKYAFTLLHFQPFGPRAYVELMVQFFFLCHHLFEQSRVQNNRLATVLAHVKDVTNTAARHTQKVLSFRAKCEEKQKCLDQLQESVDVAYKIWEQTHHQSLLEEEWLSNLEDHSHRVQQQVEEGSKQVSPLHRAAVQALSQSDLDEMRHYRMPPDGVVMVMDLICMLFNHPCGWESSKQLLMQSSFFQDLEFFDCSKLTDEMIHKLGQIIQTPSFQPSSVRDASRACESLCRWVRAVHQCACIQRRMAPQNAKKYSLDELMAESRARLRVARLQEESERERLEELEMRLELNRQDMVLLKAQLSTSEAQERESCAALKLVECHIKDWTSAGKEAELANCSIPGDALLLAAAVTYLGPFGPDVRQELLQKWHKLCLTGEMNTEPEDPRATIFNDAPLTCDRCVAIPISKTFQLALNRILGLDLHQVHGDFADLVRRVLLWGHRFAWSQRCPLLAGHHKDEEPSSQTLFPAGQFTRCEEKAHEEDKYGLKVTADDPQLLDKLNHGAKEGLRVLVMHIERATSNLQILQTFVTPGSSPDQSRLVKPAHPDFRLIMSTSLPVKTLIHEIHTSFLEEVQMIDLSPSTSEVQDLFLTELMQTECSALWTLNRQIQTKKQTLQYKLFQNEVSLMDYVIHASTALLQDPEFLPHVCTCQSVSLELETEIKDLAQEIDQHKALMADFYRIAELTTALYNALQDIARLSPCYRFTLHGFLLTLRSALALQSPDMSFHREMEPTEITYRIVSHVFSQYKPRLFKSHSALFRLLVSVAVIVHNEGCPEVERVTFLRGLSNLKSSEHFLSPSTQSVPKLPSWIQTYSRDDIYLLERIEPFWGLVSSLVNSSKLWREYLRFPSSTVIGPVPCQSHSHLSTMQRAVLWKTLCPHWLAAVEEDLTACAQGHLLHSYPGDPLMSSAEIISSLLSKNQGPVVVCLPEKNEEVPVSIHPLHLIKQVAQCQADSKGVKLSVISFGSGCHQDAVLSALDSAVQNGHWLVLNNCHLLDCWDVSVVNKLTQVVYSTTKDLETDGQLLNTGSTGRFVHPLFRLWLITKGDRLHSVPVAVRIGALHLVCDSSWDLRDELWSSVKQTLPFSSHEYTVNTHCAVLHSVLLQRQTFKHLCQGRLYHWTQEDLLALIDAHDRITKHCSDPTGALEYIAGHLVYGSHVSDHADLAAVQSLIRASLRDPSTLWGRGQHILSDIINFTGRFAGGQLKDLRCRIQCITCSTDPFILGFSPGMASELVKLKSHTLNILLHQSQNIFSDVRGDTSLFMQAQECPDYRTAWERLLALQDKLRKMDIGMGMESASLGPLHGFFQAERECLDALVSSLLLDSFQPVKYNMTSSTAAYLTSSALSRLETQADQLRSYLWEESSSITPRVYRLAAFLNPRGFLAALIRHAAHIQHKDISLYGLNFKVLHDTVSATSPPKSGVCLSGLELQGALWDPGSGVLKDDESPKPSPFPPLWVSAEENRGDRICSSESSHCNSSSQLLYYCPLYVDNHTADGGQDLSDNNIIIHVPLASRLDPMLCAMRRIRLTSTLLQ
ncbi:dynein heavy chain domain-containing protein 1 isoform X2 [Onychostoma macrolepis]|uniref:dynein heavy chain domain-containing protein 1 isoform X2 n=1 Tax=Onychostoma macrolepis TaxID=369639 RepID=UPI00272B7568|nr:dynein heavy chain domain-containing protein 1 isoform X2 [Onychostoma macrolepis]